MSHSFEARAFHPDFGNETVAGRIVVTRWMFRFESAALTLEVPFERLRVRVGTGADERLYFTDQAQPDSEIITDDFSILDLPEVGAIDNVSQRLGAEAGRDELKRRLRIVAWAAGGCVAIYLVAQLSLSFMVRSVLRRLPPQFEAQIGAAVIAEVKEEMTLVEDSNRVAALAALAAPLTQTVGGGQLAFKFYLAEDEDPNAFALPGGHVIVTTGLLNLVDRPEQVLGVIAHESAHVTQKHGLRTMIASAGPFIILRVFLGGSSSGLVRVAGDLSGLMIQQGFSQDYEKEADDVGWDTMVSAKIDPRGMIEVFRKLEEHDRTNAPPGIALPSALQSHPAMEKRIARLEKRSQNGRHKEAFQDLSALRAKLKTAAGH